MEKELIKNWNWNEAKKRLETKKTIWIKSTTDIVKELYIAREALNQRGYRTDLFKKKLYNNDITLSKLDNVTKRTFLDFLKEVDIPKSTAYNLLSRYIPEEDKLLDTVQAKEVKLQKYEELVQVYEQNKNLHAENWRPEGWSAPVSKYLLEKKIDNGEIDFSEDTSWKEAKQFSDEWHKGAQDWSNGNSVEKLLAFGEANDRYTSYLSKKIKPNIQLNTMLYVEKVLMQFEIEDRKELGRALRDMIYVFTNPEEV